MIAAVFWRCAVAAVAAELGMFGVREWADCQHAGDGSRPTTTAGADRPFGPVRQVDAGVVNIGYVEAGPADGSPVLLLHGWPYRHPQLDAGGGPVAGIEGLPGDCAVSTRLWHDGSRARRFATDNPPRWPSIPLRDGFPGDLEGDRLSDWRSANIIAALWPERRQAMVSVSGYLIGSQESGKLPLPPDAELQWWYQSHFRDRCAAAKSY